MQAPLHWLERGWQAWIFARGHAWTVLLPVVLVTLFRPRWIARGVATFSVLARVGRWLR